MGTNISGLGIANAIGFKPRVDGGRRFLPSNIKSSLVSVISTYGKKNTDSDRDILKDLTGKGNDFKLLNFGFARNSGYGLYTQYFSSWFIHGNQTGIIKDSTSVKVVGKLTNKYIVYHIQAVASSVFKIKITGLKYSIEYTYNNSGIKKLIISSDGIYDIPASSAVEGSFSTAGFYFDEKYLDSDWTGFTIEIIPDFEGWLCTDGVDDIIESVKPVSEMLEGSNEITVVSIIHQISLRGISDIPLTNYIRESNIGYVRNELRVSLNKTGIYGYTCFNIQSPISSNSSVINNILGDKEDYRLGTYGKISNAKLSVQGFIDSSGAIIDTSQVAYAGGFIANKVLTTDEINQVIAYYNLDRPGEIIKPSMLYDIRKQGITNINHAEFNDELIDYINGYNIKMYNMLWDKQSGIGNYPISFKDYTYLPARATVEINKDNFVITANTSASNFLEINTKTKSLPTYKVKIEGTSTITNGKLGYRFNTVDGTLFYKEILKDGEYEIPESPSTETATYSGWCITGGFNDSMNVKITLLAIDDITDAVVLDGINNFGKVTNVPIWKDYTICALRKWLYTATVDTGIGTGALISKSKVGSDGAFIAEQIFQLNPNITGSYNFGAGNSPLLNDKINEKSFAIQTKYTYGINRQTLSVGSGLDTNTLWLGTVRDNDPRFSYLALWNLMLFPYTMSNFILERQLKKYKLGSLYPDNSFPFRPVVTANSSTKSIQYFEVVTGKSLAVGDYVAKEQQIQLNIMLNDIDEVIKVTIDGKEVPLYSYNDGYYRYRFNIHNSYPKIDITIQEYVKYDDIVQPYPVIFVLQDKESGKELTYGNYVKVGDIIKVKSVIYYNQDLWSIHGYQIGDDSKIYSYNELINKDIVVTKPLSFGCIKKWLLSTAEPLFVYDPAIFTNSAIKTLGYLPDISGQNRHLKLYNFSYEGMSGKDGYPVVLGNQKTWNYLRPENDNWKYDLSSTSITIYKALNTAALLFTIIRASGGTIKSISIPSFKVNISGLQNEENIRYRYISNDNPSTYTDITITKNGKYELPACVPLQSDSTISDAFIGFQVKLNNNESVKGLIIEILPNYEGSLYFDGVNNYGTVQNLDHGGKCLVSKLNYNLKSSIIYDQRSTLDNTPDTNTFALYIGNNNNNVYSERLTGDVYINNVLNNYIGNTDLNNNTHVVTATCSIVDSSNSIGSIFGRSKTGSTYAQFAMYRTILLPEVPNAADRAILNKWCGLPTGYLPKPEYYWDVTGKSNSDTATRNTIKNLGTAKPVASTSDEDAYSLENKNVAYEGMSGYNGYPVVFGANKTWINHRNNNNAWQSNVSQNKVIVYANDVRGGALIWSYVYIDGVVNSIIVPEFKVKITGLKEGELINYLYVSSSNSSTITIFKISENGVFTLPPSVPIEITGTPSDNKLIGFVVKLINGISENGVTIEVLPDYYGLCLDGITNYIECANIPAFTDYTYILMRQILSNNIPNSVTMYKGIVKELAGAFTADYVINNEGGVINEFAFHSFGAVNVILRSQVANKIIWANTTSVNGIAVRRGSNTDDESITIAKFGTHYRKMVFYKLMLWSKSINNTYHINMLRNLINNSGIIDLNDSIFDQTSNE